MSDQIHYTLDQYADPGKAPPFFQLHVRPSFSPLDINIAFLGRTGWQQSTDRIRFHTEPSTPKASTHPLAEVLHPEFEVHSTHMVGPHGKSKCYRMIVRRVYLGV